MYTDETLKLHTQFFEKIISELNLHKTDGNIIPVLHLLPDAHAFTNALQKIADVPFIIPKPNTIDPKVQKQLAHITLLDIIRSEISNEIFINKIPKVKTVFFDIGGYFSSASGKIKDFLEENFCGIVEDTENGLQKYLKEGVNFPFTSIARSDLKENEDYIVGQAIAYSIERVLREHGVILNNIKFGILGYGKIGKSIAHSIQNRQGDVSINDINPIKTTHAYSHGFNTNMQKDILTNSDVICIATGNVALGKDEFPLLKNGAWVFSVTSSDDSLNTEWLKENYEHIEISNYVEKYFNDNHYFYLINRGNSINFIHGTTVGNFILLVQAEILVALHKLLNTKNKDLHKITKKDQRKICSVWLEIFT